MDGATSTRKYPAYTTAQLEAAVAAGKGTPAMRQEIADRKAGVSVPLVVPQIVPKPAIYRNTRFVERNYECTNVVACQPLSPDVKVPEGYEIGDDAFCAYARNLTPLWIEAGVRFLGYL